MVNFVHSKLEFDAVLAGNKMVVVDFTATWCGPCRMIAPVFEKLAHENPDVVFIKVDVDEVADVCAFYGIRSMPTFIFIKNKEKVSEFSGADPKKLVAEVAKLKAHV